MPLAPSKYTVSMSCLAPPGQFVELVGDFPDWEHPIPMAEVAAGDYQCSVALLPGIYRYKFRLNRRLWFPDPRASLIDTSNPFRNAILVIGGLSEPFLFAPDRRHLTLSERGRLAVQIEALHGVPEGMPLELLVNVPGLHWDSVRFEEVARQRGASLLRAEITRPVFASPESRANFRFSWAPSEVFPLPVLPRPLSSSADGTRETNARQHFNVPVTRPRPKPDAAPQPPIEGSGLTMQLFAPARPLLLDEAPPWLAHAVIYSIFTDRWLRGSDSPPASNAKSRLSPSGPWTFYGGDFAGIREHLDHIEAVGANTVLLSSVRPSPSPLRRAASDLLSVDPELGGEEGLQALVQAVHARRMKIVVEANVTYLSCRHPLFQRVVRDQELSDYADWFHIRKFPMDPADPDSFEHVKDHPECPVPDLKSEGPRRYAIRSFDGLLKTGVDGVLLHGLNDAPFDLWRLLRARLRRQNPDLLVAGRATGDNVAAFSGSACADAIFDPRHRENLNAFFGAETIDALTFCQRVGYDDAKLGPLPETFFIQALDTLDSPRFLSSALLQDRLRLSLAWLFLRPGPVCITYGTELGAEFLDSALVTRNAWRERPPVVSLPTQPGITMRLLSRLSGLRRTLKPLSEGTWFMGAFAERALAIERRAEGQVIRAFFNAGRASMRIPHEILPDGALPLLDVNVLPRTPDDVLPPRSARIFSMGIPEV